MDRLLKQRYRITAKLGGGGMGEVYLAADTKLGNRLVAVKEMRQDKLKPDEILAASRAFEQEALLLAHLTYHHLPRIHDHFEEAGNWYLVMDFIDGKTLEDYQKTRGGKLPIGEVLDIGVQLCTVLHFLHTQQPRPIIFRDLKPSNIMRTQEGHIYLIDFGIARHFKQGQPYDTVLGLSAGYAPREQWPMYHQQTTPQSDIYSLGATLHHLLTGHHPATNTPSVFDFAPLQSFDPSLPSALNTLIMRMVEKEANDRPANILSVKEELQHIAAQRATEATNPSVRVQTTLDAQTGKDIPSLPGSQQAPVPAMTGPSLLEPVAPIPLVTIPPSEQIHQVPSPEPARTLIHPGFSLSQPPQPPLSGPQPPVLRRDRLPGRAAVFKLGLLILVLVIVLGGIIFGFTMGSTLNAHLQATATASAKATATDMVRAGLTATTATAFSAYDTAVAAHGIMFGFDAAHAHSNPYERVLNTANVAHITQLWSFATGDRIYSSPAVANGMVYVGSWDGKLYAFDATCRSDCQPLWSFATGNDHIDSSPAVANGMVYVGSGNHTLYAFDATCRSDCQPLWSFTAGKEIWSSPVVANDMVYVGSWDGKLYAFDATCRSDCQPLWSFATGNDHIDSPAVANGIVYVGSNNGKLYAFAATCRSSCQPLWSFTAGSAIGSSPAIANGMVYVGSWDHTLYAFAAACRSDCQPLWSFATRSAISSSPAIANGMVYVGSDDHRLYAFDATCRHSCQPLWSFLTTWNINSSPTVANGVVYVGTQDHKLYAFDATCRHSCQPLRSFTVGDGIESSPAIANGMVYVGSNDHKLYAFGLPHHHETPLQSSDQFGVTT